MRKTFLIAMMILILPLFAGCEREGDRPIPATGGVGPSLNVEKEVQFLQTMVRKDPKNVQAWVKLGNILMDGKRYPEAIEAYGKALEIDPNDVDVRVDRGICYRLIGRSDIAVQHFREGIKINPRHLNANKNLGVVLAYDIRDYKGAIDAFQKYLDIAPGAEDRKQVEEMIVGLKAEMQGQPQASGKP